MSSGRLLEEEKSLKPSRNPVPVDHFKKGDLKGDEEEPKIIQGGKKRKGQPTPPVKNTPPPPENTLEQQFLESRSNIRVTGLNFSAVAPYVATGSKREGSHAEESGPSSLSPCRVRDRASGSSQAASR